MKIRLLPEEKFLISIVVSMMCIMVPFLGMLILKVLSFNALDFTYLISTTFYAGAIGWLAVIAVTIVWAIPSDKEEK